MRPDREIRHIVQRPGSEFRDEGHSDGSSTMSAVILRAYSEGDRTIRSYPIRLRPSHLPLCERRTKRGDYPNLRSRPPNRRAGRLRASEARREAVLLTGPRAPHSPLKLAGQQEKASHFSRDEERR